MSQCVSVTATDGSSHCVPIDINTTVADVKASLEKLLQVQPERFDLLHEGEVLQCGSRVSDLGIIDGSELIMAVSPVGEALTKLGDIKPTIESLQREVQKGGYLAIWLLRAGVPIDSRGPDFQTPLLTACKYGKTSMAKMLINQSANVNLCDANGVTPIMLCCLMKQIELTSILLQKGANVTDGTVAGTTPLIISVRRSSPDVVKLLLEHGAGINTRDDLMRTAVMYACGNQYPEGEHVDI
eukprot:TRINITY_DN37118_c0_g1_i1.p1 TRINITY_DN37118_c0_g1~~TRINITY_DN37118_c0_g1_i1.p1  ORF type:complete len:241 (+),score=51.32 TRINITY_DN37118_c0_g1_i1:20-742(+)